MADLIQINLGAGARPQTGWVNVDQFGGPGIQLVHDLDVAPWPFKDACASAVWARDVFEHVDDAILFMTECWRVLAPAGTLRIHTPHFSSPDAFTDPTHRRFPTAHTFDFWIPGTVLFQHNAFYGAVMFERVDMFDDHGSMDITLRKVGG